MEQIGELTFWLKDYREDKFNQSMTLSYELWGNKEEVDDVLSIEDFYLYCRHLALAMGFAEGTVDEWFKY